MALPTSRTEFKELCLRNLGFPIIQVEISDQQMDDRVDEALKMYWDYHFDGTEHVYLKHEITQEDADNGYFTLPDNILGAVRIFEISSALATSNIFDIRYQIALNDLYTLTSVSMVPYYMAMQHIQLLAQLLVGQQPIRYNRKNNRLYVDMDWTSRLNPGTFLIVEAYQLVDPDEFTTAWSDRWLIRYATALFKKQWGSNIKKFGNMQLPGGTTFNGQVIYDEAMDELAHMEAELINTYSLPVYDMIG